ncbi:hypothetical protein FSP39_004634 [Pinctada imbricata]|uniref:39S ribosomal protein L55, mitochondrial n=1 Tax=Pinctada imbricata TaxID=66713 RepID=A0AA89C0H8_PINIB|nr:hypothetical protein FSP39_004634 [Pinctada imbricata]
MYVRQYPTTIVLPNGATIQARYKEPRQIIKLPIDISTLTEEELEALKRKRKPKEVFVEEKEIEDSFDKNKYSKYWKR